MAGSISQVTGRRLTMILFLLLGAFFMPLWVLPSNPTNLRFGAFLVQFGVQGAIGVVPIWLAEMAPPGFLAFFPGFIAQVGNVSRLRLCLFSRLADSTPSAYE
jgi:SHS family lactate transporter-like MFS transporter